MRSSVALLIGSILMIAWANAQAVEGEVHAATAEVPIEATQPAAPAPDATIGAEPADAAEAEVAAETLAPEPTGEAAVEATLGELVEVEAPVVATTAPALGEIGYDTEGRAGRIHIVVPSDTLWDISSAYLGTPWVWPSIWQDNREIANPHLIHPGDRIWITSSEMRRVTEQEAEALLAGAPPASPEAAPELVVEEVLPTPAIVAPVVEEQRIQRVSTREAVGLITAEEFDGSASIVDAIPPRVMLSQNDVVYIGLGEGEVAEGDQFTIFRKREKVRDPDTHKVLGYHVDILGWLEVVEIHSDTASAKIELSVSGIVRGDRLIERDPMPTDILVLEPPIEVSGKISFFAHSRTLMGETDYVYLNRGSLDGLEVGSPLEVYRAGHRADERARGTKVRTPDRVIAGLLVVRAQPETAVAFVTYSDEEIGLGDPFRGSSQ